jgi:hypothetical protein
VDITSHGPVLALGKGWYPVETHGDQRFRWSSESAEFRLAVLDEAPYRLILKLEPGPGVELQPFLLSVFDGDGKPLRRARVAGRERVTLELPPLRPGVHRFTLRSEGGGKRVDDDPRALEFRVFEFEAQRGELDVVPPAVQLLKGWYPLETFAGETFRWVRNDAILSVPADQEPFTVLVESGPGFGFAPFALELRGPRGTSTVTVGDRTVVRIPVPGEYVLHVEGGGQPAADDRRVLNFRVFRGD